MSIIDGFSRDVLEGLTKKIYEKLSTSHYRLSIEALRLAEAELRSSNLKELADETLALIGLVLKAKDKASVVEASGKPGKKPVALRPAAKPAARNADNTDAGELL